MERVLTVSKRIITGKSAAANVRNTGAIPGILYGEKALREPLNYKMRKMTKKEKSEIEHTRGTLVTTPIKLIENELKSRGASIMNTLYRLEVDGVMDPMPVFMRDLQLHAIHRYPTHVSYMRYNAIKGAKVNIPLYYAGEEKIDGFIHKTRSFLPCKVYGEVIPPSILVDVSNLKVGDHISLDDLTLPDNVDIVWGKRLQNEGKVSIATIGGKKEYTGEYTSS